MTSQTLPHLPRWLALAATPLPLAPVSVTLTALTRKLAARHPGLLRRMGPHAQSRILLDLTDLPFLLLLELGPAAPRVTACPRRRCPGHDCRIAGLTAAFLGMLHGTLDGDALFFSRGLVIEGDTEAALALRNTIDDAELDLAIETAHLVGPFAPFVTRFTPLAERLTGMALHRMDMPGGVAQ